RCLRIVEPDRGERTRHREHEVAAHGRLGNDVLAGIYRGWAPRDWRQVCRMSVECMIAIYAKEKIGGRGNGGRSNVCRRLSSEVARIRRREIATAKLDSLDPTIIRRVRRVVIPVKDGISIQIGRAS